MSLTREDALEFLGFKRTDNPTEAEIKKAFRQKALKAHPDKGGSQEQFILLKEAYETLSKDKESHESFSEMFTNPDNSVDDIIAEILKGTFGDFFGDVSTPRGLSEKEYNIFNAPQVAGVYQLNLNHFHNNSSDWKIAFQRLRRMGQPDEITIENQQNGSRVWGGMVGAKRLIESLQSDLHGDKKSLQAQLDEYLKNAKYKDDYLKYEIAFSNPYIKADAAFPEYVSELLVEALEKSKVYKVTYPDGLFNESQKKRLADLIEKNKMVEEEVRKEQLNITLQLYTLDILESRFKLVHQILPLLSVYPTIQWHMQYLSENEIFDVLGFLAEALPDAAVVAAAVYAAVKMAYWASDHYLRNSIHYYDTLAKVDAVTNATEKAALKTGTEATTWSGYVKSYSKPCAWMYPRAFRAGLNHAMNQDEDMLERINPSVAKEGEKKSVHRLAFR